MSIKVKTFELNVGDASVGIVVLSIFGFDRKLIIFEFDTVVTFDWRKREALLAICHEALEFGGINTRVIILPPIFQW